jgi:hypothetical protein
MDSNDIIKHIHIRSWLGTEVYWRKKNMVFLQFIVPPLLSLIRYPYNAQCPWYLTLPAFNLSRAEISYSISDDICVIRTQQDALFFLLIYFNNHTIHVSNGLTIHHQAVVYCICSIWYLPCIRLIGQASGQSTCTLLVFITQIYHDARSTECQKRQYNYNYGIHHLSPNTSKVRVYLLRITQTYT